MQGLMTEREWRRHTQKRQRRRSDCWGAQYVLNAKPLEILRKDRAFHVFLLLLSTVVAFCLPVFTPRTGQETFVDAVAQEKTEAFAPRSVSAISYAIPSGLETVEQTYTYEQLSRGRMMLIDQAHPLPKEAPAPNTMSVGLYGSGMITVRNLQIRSGRETIAALKELFAALQAQGVKGLTVWDGTLSPAQQRTRQMQTIRTLMRDYPPDQAVEQTLEMLDTPGSGEMQQEYTVELRFQTTVNDVADERLPEQTPQGQKLLQTAWRYGFVRTDPAAQDRNAFRFRWVGKAHATAMTYLDVSLQSYLEWMHRQQVLAISESGKVKYMIFCKPVIGTHVAFTLPANAVYEASLDNMGYALVACTMKEEP